MTEQEIEQQYIKNEVILKKIDKFLYEKVDHLKAYDVKRIKRALEPSICHLSNEIVKKWGSDESIRAFLNHRNVVYYYIMDRLEQFALMEKM